jgi:hypothetical protein
VGIPRSAGLTVNYDTASEAGIQRLFSWLKALGLSFQARPGEGRGGATICRQQKKYFIDNVVVAYDRSEKQIVSEPVRTLSTNRCAGHFKEIELGTRN